MTLMSKAQNEKDEGQTKKKILHFYEFIENNVYVQIVLSCR